MVELWKKLKEIRAKTRDRSILQLFEDENRLESFSAETCDMLLDFSKTSIDQSAFQILLALARKANVDIKRESMFSGERINSTENRSVLHTALRTMHDQPLFVDGTDVMSSIKLTLAQMVRFAEGVRNHSIRSSTDVPFTDVVNIGIGGSDLGPAMACQALTPYRDGPRCHFVSNVDAAHFTDTFRDLDPKTTLAVIASKTFTTVETMTNAKAALAWLTNDLGDGAADHLAAVSTATDKTSAMGISPDRVFGFADSIGGRYSMWGPVGLPIMLTTGAANFSAFLSGAAAIDKHFRTEPFERNLPVLLALVGIWHRNICQYPTRTILPYDQRLARLPAYLQQLDMESNGKRVTLEGMELNQASGPVVWGEPGTNGQHAFYQLLHQGTDIIPAEFLIAVHGHETDLKTHHNLLKANCLAQSEALMRGRTLEEAMNITSKLGFTGVQQQVQASHRVFPGNRPSTTLVYPKLTPFTLGQIIALYEHRVFVEGAIWGINSFDQWGVELGKELANSLLPMLDGAPTVGKDPSTQALISRLSA